MALGNPILIKHHIAFRNYLILNRADLSCVHHENNKGQEPGMFESSFPPTGQLAMATGCAMHVIRIEDWTIDCRPAGPQMTEEVRALHLKGRVLNHPRYPLGGIITTSSIAGRRGHLVITHSGSIYELGRACPEHEAQFQNPVKQLLQTHPEI
jgi:hypothetical protein